MRPSSLSAASASRTVLRETKNSLASSASLGQAVGVAAGVDLVPQHIGDQARLVGARPADRCRLGMLLTCFLAATVTSPGLFVV